ncbi:integrin alpha-M-like [Hoplias malabaricus]|uniref:integrin alpha-M-like n=1 Tax=Hoplias malabaricus TaxID=27720 RepID=UPI0034629F41
MRKELRQVTTLWKDTILESTEQIAALQKQLDYLVLKLSKSAQTECEALDMIFLLDGSGSMTDTSTFIQSKGFIWDVVTRNKNSSIQFAAAQFSSKARTIFTFKDYKEGTAKEKNDKEKDMGELSNTYNGIEHVLVNLFNDTKSGASPAAKKVLVIITDGRLTDYDAKDVLKQCDEQGILRIVIGVGIIQENIGIFASEPKDENMFLTKRITDISRLPDKLQTKISIGFPGVC